MFHLRLPTTSLLIVLVSNWPIACKCQDVDFSNKTSARAYYSIYDSTWCEKDRAEWHMKAFEPMRIQSFIVNISELKPENQSVIKEILRTVTNFYFTTLRVRRADGRIGIPKSSSCENAGITFPGHVRNAVFDCQKDATGGLENLDYLVYVSAINDSQCKVGVLAWANKCATSSIDQRPIAGTIKLCPNRINTESWNRLSLTSLLKHELLHAMGFDKATLTSKSKPYNRTWKIHNGLNYTHVAKLVTTPKVQDFVRQHFDCNTLEGAELENEGGVGTKHAHWEKRIFGPEVMTGYISRQTFFSGLTAAFLEDTGWYEVNPSALETYEHAKGLGCIYAKQSCREYMDYISEKHGERAQAKAKPFCNWADYVEKMSHGSTVRECDKDHQFFTSCDWTTSRKPDNDSNLQYYFQDKWTIVNGKNISGVNVAGYAHWSDSCPQWQENFYGGPRSGRVGRVGDSVCSNAFSQPPAQVNWGAEQYSDNDSICLKQDGKFEVYDCIGMGVTEYATELAHGAGCYKYKCERGRLMIQANFSTDSDKTYMKAYKVCWGEGTVIYIRRHQRSGANGQWRYHKGILVCPSCKEICENNAKYPKFNCSKDYRINTTDYSRSPCTGVKLYVQSYQLSLALIHLALMLFYFYYFCTTYM